MTRLTPITHIMPMSGRSPQCQPSLFEMIWRHQASSPPFGAPLHGAGVARLVGAVLGVVTGAV
jgi:hypothetical protein